jgi:hypothetical protein
LTECHCHVLVLLIYITPDVDIWVYADNLLAIK